MSGSISSQDGDLGFQIAPMVDVVFVLLLFFMACAATQIAEREIQIGLAAMRAEGTPPTVISIEIGSEGQVTVNDRLFGAPTDRNLTELKEWLKGVVEDYSGKDIVIIRPRPETRHERIADVLNACAYAKVKKLSFG